MPNYLPISSFCPNRIATALTALVIASGAAHAGEYVSVNDILSGKHVVVDAEPRSSAWRISAGAIWRDIGDVQFHSGSRSQQLRLPSLVGREFRNAPTAAGRPGETSFREYNDGFVRSDAGTKRDGFTWNWGYDKASQVQGDQLVYSLGGGSQRTVSRSSRSNDGSWGDESEFEPGPYIEIDRLIPLNERLLVGPQFNFSFVSVDRQHGSSTFSQHQSSETRSILLTDRFDLDGIIPPLAPYAGSAAGPGPLINNHPSSRSISSRKTDTSRADFFNRVDENLELDLFTIGAGAHVEYDLGKLFVQASAGVTLNIADWEASHRETLYASRNGGKAKKYRRWSARENGTDLLLGAYVQGKVGLQLTERVNVSGFARYDWSQSLSGNVGPSSFDVDLDGFSAGVMVGFTF